MKKKKLALPYRRKRESKTNYNRRLKLLLSKKPRLVIRKSSKNIMLQIVEYSPKGDLIKISAHSRELRNYGWQFKTGNLPAAYLTGFLFGKKAMAKGEKEAIVDMGFYQSINGSRIYAALKGAIDAGLSVPCNEEVFPDPKRISGEHIKNYAEQLKKQSAYEKQFSEYLKNKVEVERIKELVEETKEKIIKASFNKSVKTK